MLDLRPSTDGKPLSRATVISHLANLCRLENIDPSGYSGHSFRRGGATSLARAGTPHWVIQLLGRWSSDAYKQYLALDTKEIADFAMMVKLPAKPEHENIITFTPEHCIDD